MCRVCVCVCSHACNGERVKWRNCVCSVTVLCHSELYRSNHKPVSTYAYEKNAPFLWGIFFVHSSTAYYLYLLVFGSHVQCSNVLCVCVVHGMIGRKGKIDRRKSKEWQNENERIEKKHIITEYRNKSENSERILLDFKLLYFLINIALVFATNELHISPSPFRKLSARCKKCVQTTNIDIRLRAHFNNDFQSMRSRWTKKYEK